MIANFIWNFNWRNPWYFVEYHLSRVGFLLWKSNPTRTRFFHRSTEQFSGCCPGYKWGQQDELWNLKFSESAMLQLRVPQSLKIQSRTMCNGNLLSLLQKGVDDVNKIIHWVRRPNKVKLHSSCIWESVIELYYTLCRWSKLEIRTLKITTL